MNATELIAVLAQKLKLSKPEAGKRLDDMVALITAELIESNIISITNFGNFEVKKRNERINVHPETGKRMLIPPKLVVKFKASPSFNKKIKELNHG
ncbi:MAG: HU family DNA-binding protein [Candidatus Symbiothrix sp.]|jgi:nucleoid DNA-binding protein|nr:HU family DNA-binding protein [Candidatus Symbiothrix sp.]